MKQYTPILGIILYTFMHAYISYNLTYDNILKTEQKDTRNYITLEKIVKR